MSDSMAFLAGAAFAGIAALLLLKGGGNLPASSLGTPTPLPPPPIQVQPTPLPPPPVTPALNNPNIEQQRNDIERLKTQLEQQRHDTEQLRDQLRNQQLVVDSLRSQLQVNNLKEAANQGQMTLANQQQSNPMVSGILWGVAGVVVTVLLGGVVIAVFILLFQQQRPVRTVQFIDPNYFPSLPPRRRSEWQPPRLKDRPDPEDYEG